MKLTIRHQLWLIILLLSFLILGGCGTMTPEEREDLRWEKQLGREQKQANIAYCKRRQMIYYEDDRIPARTRWMCITRQQLDDAMRRALGNRVR